MFDLFKINEIFSDNNKKKKKNIFASKANNKKNHDKAIKIEKIFKGETNSKANNKKKNHDKNSKIDKIFKNDKISQNNKNIIAKEKLNCPMPSPSSSFQGFLGANSLPLTKNI